MPSVPRQALREQCSKALEALGRSSRAVEASRRALARLPRREADELLQVFASRAIVADHAATRRALIEVFAARTRPQKGARPHRSLLSTLGTLRLVEGDAAGALDAHRRAQGAPGRSTRYEKARTAFGLARALAELGRLDEAEAALEPALRPRREWEAAWSPFLAQLAEVKRDLGKVDDAVHWFDEAAKVDPDEGMWPRAAALVLDKAGRRETATAWWRRVLAIPASRATKATIDSGNPGPQRDRWRRFRAEAWERLGAPYVTILWLAVDVKKSSRVAVRQAIATAGRRRRPLGPFLRHLAVYEDHSLAFRESPDYPSDYCEDEEGLVPALRGKWLEAEKIAEWLSRHSTVGHLVQYDIGGEAWGWEFDGRGRMRDLVLAAVGRWKDG